MALARIITRSQECSRELALDLLARGYAVEIVSPDKIPDNIADLELRVDTAPGDQLIASVEARDGERSASLDFVHHLKAPMVDFMRRSPELRKAVYFPAEPVSFDAESSGEVEEVELPAAAPPLAPESVPVAANTFNEPELHFEQGARLISPSDTSASLEMEPRIPIQRQYSAEDLTVKPRPRPAMVQPIDIQASDSQSVDSQPVDSQPRDIRPIDVQPPTVWPARPSQRSNRPARSFKRDAMIFAGVLLLALVLGYGIRRNDSAKASAQKSGAVQAGNTETVAAASTRINLTMPENSGKVTEKDAMKPAIAPAAIHSQANSDQLPTQSQPEKPPAAVARTSIAATAAKISRNHDEGLIARDTVTYLDQRFKPVPKPKATKTLAHRKPGSHNRGGIVAANSVTYLNNTPAPKTTKQNSALNPSKDN
jgi:hypothetical protein